MPLIASISGIRGVFGDGLSAEALVRYAQAYGRFIAQRTGREPLLVVGRDGRVTGEVVARLVTAALQAAGCHVVDAGLAPTPTVAMGILKERADGGIVLSASHNPAQWNALKLLDGQGEFLDAAAGRAVLAIASAGEGLTQPYDRLGSYREADLLPHHIQAIVALPYIEPEAIAARRLRVVVDGINSVGGFALPALLEALGVAEVEVINGEPTGRFAHDPEPLPQHVTEICTLVRDRRADLGLVVDPDVDRLALIDEHGRFIGEEKTQVLAAEFIMRRRPGPFATNLSSSRLIDEVMVRYGQPVYRSAVGEAHVVAKMKEVGAVLGGEGNGGVILPDLHYGRDALAGTALILQLMAETGAPLSALDAAYPQYHMVKNKVALDGLDTTEVLARLAERYRAAGHAGVSTIDGVRVDLAEGWVHVRPSNTEPILRIYAEAETPEGAAGLAARFEKELLAAA